LIEGTAAVLALMTAGLEWDGSVLWARKVTGSRQFLLESLMLWFFFFLRLAREAAGFMLYISESLTVRFF
jgi:hypothetical protein